MSIGILSVIPEDSATIPYSLHLDATSTVIILEGTVVLVDLRSPPKAMCLLFWAHLCSEFKVSCCNCRVTKMVIRTKQCILFSCWKMSSLLNVK